MYQPEKSNISAETMRRFLETPSHASVMEVPGVGAKSAEVLKAEGIINIEDLLKQKKMFDNFFKYLKSKLKGVNRHKILYALNEYEKEDGLLLGESSNPPLVEELELADKRCLIS